MNHGESWENVKRGRDREIKQRFKTYIEVKKV